MSDYNPQPDHAPKQALKTLSEEALGQRHGDVYTFVRTVHLVQRID